jgi:hypothetical protein
MLQWNVNGWVGARYSPSKSGESSLYASGFIPMSAGAAASCALGGECVPIDIALGLVDAAAVARYAPDLTRGDGLYVPALISAMHFEALSRIDTLSVSTHPVSPRISCILVLIFRVRSRSARLWYSFLKFFWLFGLAHSGM